MRKNKSVRTSLGVLVNYRIKGLNLDGFINLVKNRGIELYNLKKRGNKELCLSVKFNQCAKFFAIAKEMCYNIEKVGESGKGYPVLALYRSVGVIACIAVFTAIVYLASDFIFAFNFTGSGSVYAREIKEYLSSRGIIEFSRFSNIDLPRLEDEILAENKNLSFVSVQKKGNRLIVNSATSTSNTERLNGNVYSLTADQDGVVEKIKVYRGTALVKVGQAVKKGDLLVDGQVVVKEQTLKTNVIAYLSLVCEKKCEYRSQSAGEEQKAIIIAESEFLEEPLGSTVSVRFENGQYIYTVSVSYRKILYAG